MAFCVTHNCSCHATPLTSSCPASQACCSNTLRNCLWLQHNLLVISLWACGSFWQEFFLLCCLSGLVGKESACNAGDWGLIPGLGRSPGEGNGNPLQYSCLENSVDRGAWQAALHGITKNWTWLCDFFVLLSYRTSFYYLLIYHSLSFLKHSKQY